MNKKVKIYISAVAVGLIVAGALTVMLLGENQQTLPSDSPATVEVAVPEEAVAKPEADEPAQPQAPVMAIPETPNGVIGPKHPVETEAALKPEPNLPEKPAVPKWRGPTLEDLEKLRSENALLEAQLKNSELKSKIATQGGPAAVHDGSQGGDVQSAGPRVVMIAGGENNFRANVVMPSGAAISAGVGTTIPGVGVVSAITPNEVIVGRGSAKRALPLFSRTADGY